MYKLITSAKAFGDLSIGFVGDRGRRQRKLTINKNQKGKVHVRNMLKDDFHFAEHQEKATNGLGHKLTLTRNSDNSVLNEANANNNAKIRFVGSEGYVPHYTLSSPQQAILSKQFLSKTSTELQFVERSVFITEVGNRNFWTLNWGFKKA